MPDSNMFPTPSPVTLAPPGIHIPPPPTPNKKVLRSFSKSGYPSTPKISALSAVNKNPATSPLTPPKPPPYHRTNVLSARKSGQQPGSPPPSLADIVREETEDGRVIVRFLIDVMQGQLENSKPCHQLDAARQLLNLGFHPAQSFIDANTHASPTRKNSAPSALSAVNPSPLHQELAALIREETDNGRTTVRFLVDVMAGQPARLQAPPPPLRRQRTPAPRLRHPDPFRRR